MVDAIPATWHDAASAAGQWQDAPADTEVLLTLLAMAKQQVIAYAPEVPAGAVGVPANYRYAQLMQARNIWNAAKVDPSNGQFGDDTFQIRPFPLDWMIRQILRPKTGVPWVG